MKKMNFFLLIILIFSLFVVAGCGSAKNSTDEGVSYISVDDIPSSDIGVLNNEEKTEVIAPVKPSTATPTTEKKIVAAPIKTQVKSKNNLPIRNIKEGELASFKNVRAVDPDGDKITYTFSSPLNDVGEWQTKKGDAGEYVITISASDGKAESTQQVVLVVKQLNNAPKLEKISFVVVKEGETVSFSPKVSDEDNNNLVVSYAGWMDGSTYKTDYDDSGDHVVTVTVSDGKEEVSQDVKVTVINVNRAPKLNVIEGMTALEGDTVLIGGKAYDPDGDKVTITYSAPLDKIGSWKTKVGDAGNYEVTITASDNQLTDSQKIKITINKLNRPPVLEKIADVVVNETDTVKINAVATDPDNDPVIVTYSGWMTSATKKTTYDDAGEYVVTITASDGKDSSSQDVKITINNKNRAPKLVI